MSARHHAARRCKPAFERCCPDLGRLLAMEKSVIRCSCGVADQAARKSACRSVCCSEFAGISNMLSKLLARPGALAPLVASLALENQSQEIGQIPDATVTQQQDLLLVTFPGDVLFNSGSATLSAGAQQRPPSRRSRRPREIW
jgi:flagellar motor protein MotB